MSSSRSALTADRLILACRLVIEIGVPDGHIIHLHLPADEDMVDEHVQGFVGIDFKRFIERMFGFILRRPVRDIDFRALISFFS